MDNSVHSMTFIPEDAKFELPRAVTAEELNRTRAERTAMSDADKEKLSEKAWAPLVDGSVKMKGYILDSNSSPTLCGECNDTEKRCEKHSKFTVVEGTVAEIFGDSK